MGLCFWGQVVDVVPVENHDVEMDMVVTEEGIYGECKMQN